MMRTSRNKEAYRLYKEYCSRFELNRIPDSVMTVYKTTPSIYKQRAERAILEEMRESGGHGYTIISHNGFMFTCGYVKEDENGNKFLVYHTKEKREEILIDGEYHYWQQA